MSDGYQPKNYVDNPRTVCLECMHSIQAPMSIRAIAPGYPVCAAVSMGANPITGGIKYQLCSEINVVGECQLFHARVSKPRKPWWKRWGDGGW